MRTIDLEGNLHMSHFPRLSPRSNPDGGGCVNLAHHVRCSTVSQTSITLFQHQVLTATAGMLRDMCSVSWSGKTVHSTVEWGGYPAQRCYSRTRLLQQCQNLTAPHTSPSSLFKYPTRLRIVYFKDPGCLERCRAPISTTQAARPALVSIASSKHFAHRSGTATRELSSWCAPSITVGHLLRRVPLPASSRLTD